MGPESHHFRFSRKFLGRGTTQRQTGKYVSGKNHNLLPDLEANKVGVAIAEVHSVGQVKANLSSVPDSAFHTFATTCRGDILVANVTVDMLFASADIRFEVMFEGESYGNTQIEY